MQKKNGCIRAMEIIYLYPSVQEPLSDRNMHMTKLFRKSASIIEHIWKGKADNLSEVHSMSFFLQAFIITALNSMLFNALDTPRTYNTHLTLYRKKKVRSSQKNSEVELVYIVHNCTELLSEK